MVTNFQTGLRKHFVVFLTLAVWICVLSTCSYSTDACGESVGTQSGRSTSSGSEILYRPLGYVSDFSGIISAETKAKIEQIAREMDKNNLAQLAVVTLPTTDGMPVNAFATKLFNQWGIGKKETNNGLMILVVTRDHLVRVEVGRGMEKKVPNSYAEKVVREMETRFRTGNFDGGLVEATLMLKAAVFGEN